jgi:hypothetical protein
MLLLLSLFLSQLLHPLLMLYSSIYLFRYLVRLHHFIILVLLQFLLRTTMS